jgi:hypothetical protein
MLLKMKAGLSGPELSLAPGDTHDFDDADEAQRLIDAGYAEPASPETPKERVTRLKNELKEAEAAVKAAPAAGA